MLGSAACALRALAMFGSAVKIGAVTASGVRGMSWRVDRTPKSVGLRTLKRAKVTAVSSALGQAQSSEVANCENLWSSTSWLRSPSPR